MRSISICQISILDPIPSERVHCTSTYKKWNPATLGSAKFCRNTYTSCCNATFAWDLKSLVTSEFENVSLSSLWASTYSKAPSQSLVCDYCRSSIRIWTKKESYKLVRSRFFPPFCQVTPLTSSTGLPKTVTANWVVSPHGSRPCSSS